MLNPLTGLPLVNGANQKNDNVDLPKLKKACEAFESIFLNYMLKTARSTTEEDSLMGKSSESEIMNSMLDENLAKGMSQGGGVGLAQILFNYLKDRKISES